jgi:glutamyl-tRNA synthetase
MVEVRTRFAPSPTGLQHIGGIRTAFFSWLLAKKYEGAFLLRIEDTDQTRRVPGAIKYLIEELTWFGINIDEGPSKAELNLIGEDWDGAPDLSSPFGPYIQTLRKDRYIEIAELLVDQGYAYRCDYTAEMLEKERFEQQKLSGGISTSGFSGITRHREVSPDEPHTIRLKIPPRRQIVLDDKIKGKVIWNSIPLKDPVILKSDKLPTYHLASVVDDHDMRISHVVRSDEWIPTSPLHILLYELLEWEKPTFVHVPPVLGVDGKKLSKRHGAANSSTFRENGYLPEALLNFTVLIGWSPGSGEEQEIFSRKELIERFSLEGINRAGGVFDHKKLAWMNGIYIRNLTKADFVQRVTPFLQQHGFINECTPGSFMQIASQVQERVHELKEVPEMVEFLFRKEPFDFNADNALKKGMDAKTAKDCVEFLITSFKQLENFEFTEVDGTLRSVATHFNIKPPAVFTLVRIIVLGRPATPPLCESIVALGKEQTLFHLVAALEPLTKI